MNRSTSCGDSRSETISINGISYPDQYLCSASSTSRSEIGRVNALHAYQM